MTLSASFSSLIPNHIPENLVFDFDYIKDVEGVDPYKNMERLLEEDVPDFLYTPAYGGHWIATRYEDIQAILKDHENFTSFPILIPALDQDRPLIPQQIDPPDHQNYRRILGPMFSPAAIRKHEELIRNLTNQLIDSFIGKGECDFVAEFASKLPTLAFLKLVGSPTEQVEKLVALDQTFLSGTPEEQEKAGTALAGFTAELVSEKVRHPGDDWVSYMLSRKGENGEPELDIGTITEITYFLFIAGLDTVLNTLGHTWRYLALNQHEYRKLGEDPELVADAVEEFLRVYAVVNDARRARHDLKYKGIAIKKGEAVLLPTMLANRDAGVFENASSVQLDRETNVHLAFGAGIHRCLGSNLARIELRIALEEWLKRIPEFSIRENARVTAYARVTIGLHALPLVWSS